jgi:GT2 family glycosyltransferase
MGPAGDAAVAVAIVSWNTRDLLDRCLVSFADDAAAGRAEVWVVDNGSVDGSAQAARAHGFAHVVEAGANLGFGPAVNHVAKATTTPWIACANADVALTDGALETLLAAGRAHPGAGAIAPRLRLPDGRTQHSVHAFPTLPTLTAYDTGLGALLPGLGERLLLPDRWDADRPRHVGWAFGAFLLIRREAWDEAGGFEERRQLYTEDLDLGWRLRQTGWRTWYEPSAVVEHESSAATAQAWGDARHQRILVATYRWHVRRRGAARALAAAGLNVLGSAARALLERGNRKRRLLEAAGHASAAARAIARRRDANL